MPTQVLIDIDVHITLGLFKESMFGTMVWILFSWWSSSQDYHLPIINNRQNQTYFPNLATIHYYHVVYSILLKDHCICNTLDVMV